MVTTKAKTCPHCQSAPLLTDYKEDYCLNCGKNPSPRHNGGQVTRDKYGPSHFVIIGKLGGRPHLPTLDELKAKSQPQVKINTKGGMNPSDSRNQLKRLWRRRRRSNGTKNIAVGAGE